MEGDNIMEEHIKSILPYLNEKQKRIFLASCANTLGWGGVKKVCELTGCGKESVARGKRELEAPISEDKSVRQKGGGRKKIEFTNPELPNWIEKIVSDSTYGNPENTLIWTTQSLNKIKDALLSKHRIYVSTVTIARLLRQLEYSLQGNKKMLQVGEPHPDRNEQFEFVNEMSKIFIFDG
jgi:DNA-binding PadR family transcriptional regulator